MQKRSFRLKELADLVGGKLHGDGETLITGVAGIDVAKKGDITFLGRSDYEKFLAGTGASAVIGPPGMRTPRPTIETDKPYVALARVLTAFDRPTVEKYPRGIHETAVIDSTATLGTGVAVGPYCQIGARARVGDNTTVLLSCYVGDDVEIGKDCLIYPNATICQGTRLGDRVVLFAGTVIGGDGFGFAWDGEAHRKIPQLGTVTIEDDVEIGSNSAVDRATTGVTRIGRGTKIDNLVQVGHNVVIGENTVIAGCSGIAGSVTIGNNVTIGGQVGLVPHVEIGDGVIVGAKSAVLKSIPPGMTVSGQPAREHSRQRKLYGYTTRIPDLRRRIGELERKIEELERGGAHGPSAEDD